jgi:hypothetical protein
MLDQAENIYCDKHPSLLRFGINYAEGQSLYDIGTCKPALNHDANYDKYLMIFVKLISKATTIKHFTAVTCPSPRKLEFLSLSQHLSQNRTFRGKDRARCYNTFYVIFECS